MSKIPLNSRLFVVLIILIDIIFLVALGLWGITIRSEISAVNPAQVKDSSTIPAIDTQGLTSVTQ